MAQPAKLSWPNFTIDAVGDLIASTTDLQQIDNKQYVSTVQSLAQSAALQLLSEYANKVALWTKSEEAKLARNAEHEKIMLTFRNVFSQGKYVLLQQRDATDTGPGAKRLKIMQSLLVC